MKIGIDFDHVLFNTEKFKQYLFEEIENFDETYSDAKKKVYTPERHAKILGIEPEKIYSVLENTDNFLYTDTEKLEKLSEEHTVLIVSRGDKRFQNIKIEKSGALEHVDGLFIVHEKSKDAAGIDFLVDDREKEIERAGVPGFLFSRSEHTVEDIVEEVESRG